MQIPDDQGRRGAVAIVVRDGRFLVIRRSQHVVAPGAYCFPGGGIEPGESEPEALVREIREELGVVVEPVRRVWRSATAWRVELAWWLGRIDPCARLLPAPAEVESIHWLTAEELQALEELLPSNREFLQALAEGKVRLDEKTSEDPLLSESPRAPR